MSFDYNQGLDKKKNRTFTQVEKVEEKRMKEKKKGNLVVNKKNEWIIKTHRIVYPGMRKRWYKIRLMLLFLLPYTTIEVESPCFVIFFWCVGKRP